MSDTGKIFLAENSGDEIWNKYSDLESFGHLVLGRLENENSDCTIFVDDTSGRSWTGAKLRDAILNIACALIDKHNFKQGSIVCVNYEHYDYSCIFALGVVIAGGALCYLGLNDPHAELMYVARKVEPKFYAGHKDKMFKAERMETELGYPIVKINMDGDGSSELDLNYMLNYDHTKSANLGQVPVACKNLNQDIAFITMSSGTTGMPKAIPATHQTILCESVFYSWTGYKNIRVAAPSPLDYVSGRMVTMSAPVAGFTSVIINGYTPKSYLSAIQRHRIHVSLLGAASFHDLITYEHLKSYDISSLRSIFPMGAKIVYIDELRKFCQNNPNIISIRTGYGSSEACGVTNGKMTPEEFFRDTDNNGQLRVGVKLKVVDLETGQLLGTNRKGMLHVHSRALFIGYYDMELARQIANNTKADDSSTISPIHRDSSVFDSDGFYITDDIGLMSDKEELFLFGRHKEVMSCIGAKKVLPYELEQLIQEHPAVHQVCVVPIKSKLDILCDCPRAFIVPKPEYYDSTKADHELKMTERLEHCDTELPKKMTYKGSNKLCKLSDSRRHMIIEDLNDYINERVSVEKRLIGGTIVLDEIPTLRTTGKMNKTYLRSLTTNQVEIYGDETE